MRQGGLNRFYTIKTCLRRLKSVAINWCIWGQPNMSVGAKHDRNQYEMITNNLYAVMLRPLQE